jgi:hypothetical protein
MSQGKQQSAKEQPRGLVSANRIERHDSDDILGELGVELSLGKKAAVCRKGVHPQKCLIPPSRSPGPLEGLLKDALATGEGLPEGLEQAVKLKALRKVRRGVAAAVRAVPCPRNNGADMLF